MQTNNPDRRANLQIRPYDPRATVLKWSEVVLPEVRVTEEILQAGLPDNSILYCNRVCPDVGYMIMQVSAFGSFRPPHAVLEDTPFPESRHYVGPFHVGKFQGTGLTASLDRITAVISKSSVRRARNQSSSTAVPVIRAINDSSSSSSQNPSGTGMRNRSDSCTVSGR